MAWIKEYQLSIMLFMSGICAILSVVTLLTEIPSARRKSILGLMEMTATLLLIFDRFAYIYRGDGSDLGFYMVRISNGLVFFFSIFIPHLVTQYLKDLYRNEGQLPAPPRRLVLCDLLFVVGTVLLIISQFTGLYYRFDGQNTYQRSPGIVISYLIPILIVLIQESALWQHRARLDRRLTVTMMGSIALPTVATVLQFFYYGVSLTNMSMVIVIIVFYFYALRDLKERVEAAARRELEYYKEAQKKEAAMLEQTAEALANAIDAKDSYTRGHSARVAALSRQIAREAGMSDKDCQQVYFAALLHDVGKISVRDDVINKEGRLTDAEFEQIKRHPIYGNQILSSIKLAPSLSIGAHYHHERYDGKGYPEGLAGEAIPEIARIISVADAFDAMTSTRSYRQKLPVETVRRELEKGIGSQFDPRYARIMLELLDSGQIDEPKP